MSDLMESWHAWVYYCILGNFVCLFSSAYIFKDQLFQNIISGIPSECRDQARRYADMGPNILLRLSADDTSRQRVNDLISCIVGERIRRDIITLLDRKLLPRGR